MGQAMFGNLGRCESAAEEGEVQAQFDLGLMYANGLGLPQDLIQAYRWISLSSTAGNAAASDLQKQLAQQMTPEQIAEAERLVREWQEKRKKEWHR